MKWIRRKIIREDFTLLKKTIGISVVELNTSKIFFWQLGIILFLYKQHRLLLTMKVDFIHEQLKKYE